MANNKVQLADGTVLMDVTDTTADASEVVAGKYFYSASGVRTAGTLVVPTPLDSYPIGSIYISTVNTDPAQLFGGDWVPIKDSFLLSAGDTYNAGSTGGESSVALTVENLAAHTHGSKSLTGKTGFRRMGTSTDIAGTAYTTTGIMSHGTYTWSGSHANIASGNSVTNPVLDIINVDATHEHDSVGSGTAHNNMPPYLTVYMWQRVELTTS